MAYVVTAAPVPIDDAGPTSRRGCRRFHKALSREPGERFADVAAFRKELKRFA